MSRWFSSLVPTRAASRRSIQRPEKLVSIISDLADNAIDEIHFIKLLNTGQVFSTAGAGRTGVSRRPKSHSGPRTSSLAGPPHTAKKHTTVKLGLIV